MNLAMFSILTFLGASIWSGFLIWLGYMYGAKAGALIEDYMHEFLILAVIGT